jgi:NADH:ubiquinone oxidoreductase subunit 5 (subunit L)/multisubunit Na+/H+ antiporter MnhA subunit
MSTETLRVLRKLEEVSAAGERIFLRRELRDFQELYYAGRESEITSLLFSSATIVFYGSFMFTIFRLMGVLAAYRSGNENLEKSGWVVTLLKISGFATVFSIVGATLATFHQWRKITILSRLHRRLGQGRKVEGRLQLVQYLTRAEQILSVCRILITLCAGVSLAWSLIIQANPNDDDDVSMEDQSPKELLDSTENFMPVAIALFAVFMGVVTVAFYFLIELSVRYGLDPNLGPLVFEPFADEIETLKHRFTDQRAGGVGIETKQNIELEVWEYTAREFLHHYRFDTIFTNERFGSLFQYLQGAPHRQSDNLYSNF